MTAVEGRAAPLDAPRARSLAALLRAALMALLIAGMAAAGVLVYTSRVGVGPAVATDQVVLELNDFRPDAIAVPAGTTVTWTWQGGVTHDLVFDDGTRAEAQADGIFQRTFTTPGTYPYRCTLHGPMRGEVDVLPGSAADGGGRSSVPLHGSGDAEPPARLR